MAAALRRRVLGIYSTEPQAGNAITNNLLLQDSSADTG